MTDDHGNTIAEATTLTLNTPIPGTIDPANDVDYFRIDITNTPAIVSIFTTGIVTLDPVGSLQDNMGTQLTSDDDIGLGRLNFRIQARLNPGTYYIQVSSYRSRSTGDYVLHVDVTDDHSNIREGATEIQLDTPVSGTINTESDVDYFRIDINTPTIVLIFTTGNLNTAGALQDNTGDELDSDDDSGEEDNFLIRYRLDLGTYYIEVSTLFGGTGDYSLHVEALVQQISLIIPSELAESTNEIIGSTMIDVKHDEPFPVYISVAISDTAVDSLLLTLDGTQDGTLPSTLMTSALGTGQTWSELFVGYGTPAGTGERYYRYCYDQAGIQNCSSSILVSYSSPTTPVVDVDDEIGSEWDFTLSDQTATARCSPNEEGTFPTVLSQEGNAFTSTRSLPEISTYTGIVDGDSVDGDSVDGDSYSLAYRDPNFNVGPNVGTYIDTHATQYSDEPVALSGPGVWWWTDRAGFLCRGTYNIKYTPRPHIDSITVASTSVSEDVGNVAVTVTLTYPPVQSIVATLEIAGTATDADYQVEQDISFGIGEEQTTLNLFIVDDDLVELDETIILTLEADNDQIIIDDKSSVTLTIEDNDVPAIRFALAAYTIPEGTTGTITLVTDQPPLVKTQIRLTTLSGTTVLNEDYRLSNQLSNRIITFEPDQDTASFEVSIEDDEDVQETRELHLSFELLDSNSKPGTVSETIITIEDNELEISLRPRRIVVTESTSTGFVTLQLEASRLTSIPLTVNLRYTADVGALTGELTSDNTSEMSTMITVETNMTTRHTFEVEVKDDRIAAESTRTAQVVLRPGDGYTVSDTDNTVEIAVVDDDVATVNISSVRDRVTEGDDIEFIITKNLIADTVTSVNIEFEDMGNFFKLPTATTQVNFPADGVVMSTVKIVIPTMDNDDVEVDGSLRAAIDITGSVLRAGMSTERTVTILNNDVPAISFEEPGYVIFKGTTGTITLEADQPPVVEARISLTTISETTVSDSDYKLSTTIITFKPNQSTASFEVLIRDDVVVRSTRELSLSFDSLNNAIPGATSKTVISVRDNDMSRASLEVVGNDIRLEGEGEDSATLRVTLDLAFDRETTIQIVITGGTATLGKDYTINDNTVKFTPGSTSAETTLVVINDGQVEPDETIMLRLDTDNAQIIVNRPEAQLTLTIEDNDVPVAISFRQNAYTISEGTTTTIILEADPPPVVKTQISLTTISETTVSDGDYTLSTTIIVRLNLSRVRHLLKC